MLKFIFLVFSVCVGGCFITPNHNITQIKDNCFVEINNYNQYGHTYVLQLAVKQNNVIKFEWFNINAITNIKFSWFNTTFPHLHP